MIDLTTGRSSRSTRRSVEVRGMIPFCIEDPTAISAQVQQRGRQTRQDLYGGRLTLNVQYYSDTTAPRTPSTIYQLSVRQQAQHCSDLDYNSHPSNPSHTDAHGRPKSPPLPRNRYEANDSHSPVGPAWNPSTHSHLVRNRRPGRKDYEGSLKD